MNDLVTAVKSRIYWKRTKEFYTWQDLLQLFPNQEFSDLLVDQEASN
jgi:hypothetical protein